MNIKHISLTRSISILCLVIHVDEFTLDNSNKTIKKCKNYQRKIKSKLYLAMNLNDITHHRFLQSTNLSLLVKRSVAIGVLV